MDDPRWLRLITAGLVLAAVVIGYLLWTGKFSTTTNRPAQVVENNKPVPQMSPSPVSGGNIGIGRTNSSNNLPETEVTSTLPKTGFPLGLAGVFSLSAMTAGYYLRRFPK